MRSEQAWLGKIAATAIEFQPDPVGGTLLWHACCMEEGNVVPPFDVAFYQTLPRRLNMGSTSDRVKGAANSAVGKAKEAVGKETGDATLAAKGAAQDTKGKAQTVVGKAKAATGN